MKRMVFKRFILLITFLVSFASIYAQEKYPAYCDVYLFGERDISKNAVISFDFGFEKRVGDYFL